MKLTKVIALDVGEKRIGIAAADSATKLAYPLTTILVDGDEMNALHKLISDECADVVVIGYPRNQSGETTKQTLYVENFVKQIESLGIQTTYQDESLTSVAAENYLMSRKRPYTKSDIDAHAAAIILTDYMESHHA